ncbi:MAG: hypothetical protein ACTSRZ_04520 [Promethearchaeota archaeon]
MNYEFKVETIEEENYNEYSIIKLDELESYEKEKINPLVPPTSGLRMEIFDVEGNKYIMTKKKICYFLRVMKAIAVIGKKELRKGDPSILIVTDDRPSADILREYAARIFAFENYKIFYQKGKGQRTKNHSYVRGISRMSSPYASASVALFKQIDIVLMITASHNSLVWNGLKFYIKRPIPISGGVMRAVSEHAISLTQIALHNNPEINEIDADEKNNEYIKSLVSKIVDTSVLKGKTILLWPFLGAAPEIVSLIESFGAKVELIDENMDPPDPTYDLDSKKIIEIMKFKNIKISILLDADRDRLVFFVKSKDKYIKLSPNELYTSMMNILSSKFNKKYINIRTIPSDPGCDKNAVINFITGVGYKHLGLIQYMLANQEVPQSQLETAILYYLKDGKYTKIYTYEDIEKIINEYSLDGEYIVVLWEESGGHTFNVLYTVKDENGKISLKSDFPLIGDKYPAVAIIVLCCLLEMGFDLTECIDPNIKGTRTTIKATDEEKIKYINYFAEKIGQIITINEIQYEIDEFSNLKDQVSVVLLKSKNSELFIRPSGTGNSIRIYIFSDQKSYKTELENVVNYLKNLKI